MQLRYPGSFLKLLLIGFGLVALPLALALADAYFSLESLMQRSERSIGQAVQITRDSRALGEHITSLERLARQQLVLGERGVLDAYSTRRHEFLVSLDQLLGNAHASKTTAQLEALSESEARVWNGLQRASLSSAETRRIVREFNTMRTLAADILRLADVRIERDIHALRSQAAAAREQMLHRLLALAPIALLLTAGLVFLIRRPIRHLSAGIRDLGDGKLDQRITVSGPDDLEALGRQLDWLRLRLTEVDEQKMRFLRHVSHELKTPLTAIHEGTQLLTEQVSGPLNPEQREIASILRSNATRLRQLIENLLDYSGIRYKPMLLKREPILLASLFAQLAADQKLALAARRLALFADDGSLSLEADREKLRVILDNLLSNAIKYAPEESIIELAAREDGSEIVIEVADLGPGIPPDQTERLFEPFVQGPPPSDEASIKGTGLGLSIVRELVIAHGGRVFLLPNTPSGTRVRICLPAPGPRD